MKPILPLLCCALALALSSCEKDSCTDTWTQMLSIPVTVNRAAVQDSITAMPARELCTGGNLYAYGDYLFVNVNREGYHLLDNADPANPRNVAFLRVPGATHMAFVDGRMVSDSYADMLVLDFGGPDALALVSSTPNLLLQTDGFDVADDRVAVGFEIQEVEFTESCEGQVTGRWGFTREAAFLADASGGVGRNIQVNTGGSLARLAFCDRMLYVLATDRLTTFELEGDELVNVRETQLQQGQESMVRDGDFLYVASSWALTIIDIEDCGLPLELGRAPRWINNNDPDAVAGDLAVATLRQGNVADSTLNGSMIVYDVSDRTAPRELERIPMHHPVGVQIVGDRLYICDGWDGLLVYDFDRLGGGPGELLQRLPEADVVDLAILPYNAAPVLFTVGQHAVTQFSVDEDGLLQSLSALQAEPCVLD